MRKSCSSTKIFYIYLFSLFFFRYFTYFHADQNVEADEKLAYDPVESQLFFAHNGWVMGDDPLKNFAELPSMVRNRRQCEMSKFIVSLCQGLLQASIDSLGGQCKASLRPIS